MLFKLSNLNSNLALTLGYLNPALNNSALNLKSEAPSSSPTLKLVKSQLVRFLTVAGLRVVPHFSSGIVEQAKRERAWKSHFSRVGWFSRVLSTTRSIIDDAYYDSFKLFVSLSPKAPSGEWIIISFIYFFIFRPNWTTGRVGFIGSDTAFFSYFLLRLLLNPRLS